MGKQVTASNTKLLFQCPRPFEEDTEISHNEPGEDARYGSAYHEAQRDLVLGSPVTKDTFSNLLEKWGVTHVVNPSEFEKHVRGGTKYLLKWLKDHGFTRIVSVEKPRKWNVVTWASSDAELDLETHTYDLEENEIGGTDDLTAENPKTHEIVTTDTKTGLFELEDYTQPPTLQLRTLGLMTGATQVAIFNVPRTSIMQVYDAELQEQASHGQELREAYERVGTGFLREGPACRFCPARDNCPLRAGEILQETGKLVKKVYGAGELSEEIDRGAFLELSTGLVNLVKRGRELIKEEVRNGLVIENREGKAYEVKKRTRRGISLKSIVAALGKKAGEKEIERLEKLGCVTETEYEELSAR